MNITAPFKEDFFRLCDTVGGTSKMTGAVNTVVIRNGRLMGHNTDVYGVAQALRANGVTLKGRKAVVLGAGGAAKAAVHALLSGGAKVTVVNRTAQKAQGIAESMGCGHSSLRPVELRGAFKDAEIVVSAVSTTKRIVPRSLLKETMTILEANYSAQTALTRDAQQKGCRVIDGREWLLFQGTKAFEIFTGRKAPLEVMRKAVYAGTGKQSSNRCGLKDRRPGFKVKISHEDSS
jgi:shikimate dehydrogenase